MQSAAELKNLVVKEVPVGSRVVLNCDSNDFNHNFQFWLSDKNSFIGPGSDYDERKYKYEVLSGKLHIANVSPDEAGLYKCFSGKLDGDGHTVGQVQMVVTGAAFTPVEAVKLTAIVVSIIILISCAVIYYRLRKEWQRYNGRAGITPVDDTEDEEEGAEEVYNPTTTSISQPVPGPSRVPSSDHLLYGIDNQGLDTDFNSVFENIQIKSPSPSLI